MIQKEEKNLFHSYVPAPAVDYCFNLWKEHGFFFKITKSRRSKLGDYCYKPSDHRHVITVNHDLNPYAFTLTYLHEVAHLLTFKAYGRRVKPHGREWQQNFVNLIAPLLDPQAEVFPLSLRPYLLAYFRRPAASTAGDPLLTKALRKYDEGRKEGLMLDELPEGQVFEFSNRSFQKESTRRTRCLCKELSSGRKYLISRFAEVKAK